MTTDPTRTRPAFRLRPPSLARSVELGLALRVAAACLVHWYAGRKGTLCVFADTNIYWELARTILEREPFQVMQFDVPHFALRTPGYPLFLAACQAIFGARLMPVRLVQAALNALAIVLLYRLAARVLPEADRSAPEGWSTPRAAAFLMAVEPYTVGMSALVLSEGLFVPLMLLGLRGISVLWPGEGQGRPGPGRSIAVAVGAGLAIAAAILVRPSWALFVPPLLAAWVAFAGRGRRAVALRDAVAVALAVAVLMAPWWLRNERLFGRFVPTAMWVGASLYDGLRPGATGASDMRFLEAPDVAALGEEAQDAELTRRALAFVRAEPGRALELFAIKLGRFWSPWPNADQLRSPVAAALSAAVTLPAFALLAVGLWDRRRDPRALVLLAGTLVYFCLLHAVFVSSIRYRIPGLVPAFGLAALGGGLAAGRLAGRGRRGEGPPGAVAGP